MTDRAGPAPPAGDLATQLLDVLRAHTGRPALVVDGPLRPLTGGFWAELVSFGVRGAPEGWPAELVLRLMPDPRTAARETAVQAAVADQGYPTPTVRAAGRPGGGFDRAFMIMDRADGAPLLGGLDARRAIVTAPALLGRLPAVLAGAMARLNRLDPAPVAERLGGDAPTLAALLDELELGATACGRPDLATTARWIRDHRPPSGPDVICHGDLHPFNVLVTRAGDATVLDWSAARLAPALHDVAFTNLLLGDPPLAVPVTLRPLVRTIGLTLARRFRRAYRVHTGATLHPAWLRWHEAVTCLRALVEVAGWADARDEHAGHPWLVCGAKYARRLSRLTGVAVARPEPGDRRPV